MAQELEPEPSRSQGIVFKLDRFEPADGDRLELSGRWYGVRGRRFIRPTLTLVGAGGRYRCLADIAGKPWAAADGELWHAAFPCDLAVLHALDEAQFSVAPDITIVLPAPGGAVGERSQRGLEQAGRERQRPRTEERTLRTSEETAVRRQLAIVTRGLERERAESERLRGELERSEAERTSTASRLEQALDDLRAASAEREHAQQASDVVAAERDQARGAREQAIAERDAALRTRDQTAAERDAATRLRDHALRERETALTVRDRAAIERDQAVMARDRAAAERDAAILERDRATAALSQERGSRQRAIGEAPGARDQALGARDQALAERDALAGAIEQLESDRAEAISSRGAALVMRGSMQAGAAGHGDARSLWLPIAIVIALACLIVLAVALHVF